VIQSLFGRLAHRRISVAGIAVSIAAMVAMAAAGSASANEFSVFSDCPTANPATFECLHSVTTGGEVKIGETAVPITNPITLQGGLKNPFVSGELIAAKDGNTLSKTAQTVPGGLLNIVAPSGWPTILQELFNRFINEGITGVTATTELVGTAEVHLFPFLAGEGTAVSLPVRVKLGNAFLGNSCYIGSSSSPVHLNLTTGTTAPPGPNTPISGSVGTQSENAEGNILFVNGFKIVDNSFSAPGASGCGPFPFEFFVDLAVDLKLGLPSLAGKNTAILQGNQQLATKEAVLAHP
jgi:hypothetical protein